MSQLENRIQKLITVIFDTHPGHEVDCEMCNREFACLAEQVAAGARIGDLLPHVEAHLQCCKDCREEFEALLAVIRAEQEGRLDPLQ